MGPRREEMMCYDVCVGKVASGFCDTVTDLLGRG